MQLNQLGSREPIVKISPSKKHFFFSFQVLLFFMRTSSKAGWPKPTSGGFGSKQPKRGPLKGRVWDGLARFPFNSIRLGWKKVGNFSGWRLISFFLFCVVLLRFRPPTEARAEAEVERRRGSQRNPARGTGLSWQHANKLVRCKFLNLNNVWYLSLTLG